MRNVNFLASSGLQAKGYTMVQIDDGWQNLDRTTGWISRINYQERPNNKQGSSGLPALVGNGTAGCIVADPIKFPRGMQALGAELKQLGFKFGMYTSGTNFVCDAEVGFRGSYSSTPYGNLRTADANCFNQWGIDLLKVDACVPTSHSSVYYSNNIKFWRRALNSNVILYNCRFGCMAKATCQNPYQCPMQTSAAQNSKVSSYCTSQTDISRTGPDIKPVWSNILGAISTTFGRGKVSKPGFWSDPDYLVPHATKLSFVEHRSQFSMWCVVSAPLLISVELTTMDLPTLAMLGDDMAIGINQLYQGDAGDLKSKTGNLWEFQKKFNVKTAVVVVNVGVDRSTVSFPMQDYLTWQPKLNNFMVGAVACQYVDVWTKQTGVLTVASRFQVGERDSLFLIVSGCIKKGATFPPSQAPTTAMRYPTVRSTMQPTPFPTKRVTAAPTKRPTTTRPTKRPTLAPTKRPTKKATLAPTKRPTLAPTKRPTKRATLAPTKRPTTVKPTKRPTLLPTKRPTKRVTSASAKQSITPAPASSWPWLQTSL
ncbi:hypothetical protein BASA81_015060 [Batrachochytrium salamandrivorans]|nr:hypothetical protein BASA81_015060 [Batrachochytrium salamandrivorans]